jgi:hypothetical protein
MHFLMPTHPTSKGRFAKNRGRLLQAATLIRLSSIT